MGGLRQRALHRNGFAVIQPDAAAWFTERGAFGAWFSEPPNKELERQQTMSLDLSLLPEIDCGHMFFNVGSQLLNPITALSRTVERIENATKFAWFAATDSESLHCHEAQEPTLREGFLRASLTEFVSIEDILNLDLKQAGLSAKPFKLNDSRKPHLHLIRELRNLEVHLFHHKLSVSQKERLWGSRSQPESAKPFTTDVWCWDGVTIQAFSRLRNARNYSDVEIAEMVEWFNRSQKEWGVAEIILKVIKDYCRELATTYYGRAF